MSSTIKLTRAQRALKWVHSQNDNEQSFLCPACNEVLGTAPSDEEILVHCIMCTEMQEELAAGEEENDKAV